jgi:hypothetical protein
MNNRHMQHTRVFKRWPISIHDVLVGTCDASSVAAAQHRVQPTRLNRRDFTRQDAVKCLPAWARQCQPTGARLTQTVGPHSSSASRAMTGAP